MTILPVLVIVFIVGLLIGPYVIGLLEDFMGGLYGVLRERRDR